MSARLEPTKFNSADIHETCMEVFENKQWVNFFEKFMGIMSRLVQLLLKPLMEKELQWGTCILDCQKTSQHKLLACHSKEKGFSRLNSLKRKHGCHFCADQEQGQSIGRKGYQEVGWFIPGMKQFMSFKNLLLVKADSTLFTFITSSCYSI